MTKHDLKELAAMGAELGAAKAENERLRGLLERIRTTCCQVRDAQDLDTAPGLSAAESLHEQIEKLDAALSQQADPTDTYTAVDMATAAAQGFRDGQAAVEPAPAQDDREPVGWYTDDHLTDKSATTYDREVADRWRGKGWPVYGLYARPAQTEQPEQSEPNRRTLQWVVDRWHAEVANRPLVNVHRRTLDSTWRQMIRHLGEDDVVLLGPRHDDMLDASGNPLPQYAAALNATQQENSHE